MEQDLLLQKSSEKPECNMNFHVAIRTRGSKHLTGLNSRAVSLKHQIAALEKEYSNLVLSESREYAMVFSEVRRPSGKGILALWPIALWRPDAFLLVSQP